MRNYTLPSILLLLLFAAPAFSQQKAKFHISSFKESPLDLSAREAPTSRDDGTGELYAIIKVTSADSDDDLNAYTFDFGRLKHVPEMKDGELWLYVQYGAKNISIARKDYTPINRESLNTTLQPGRVYRLKLSAEAQKVFRQMLEFNTEPAVAGATIMIKGQKQGAQQELFGTTGEQGSVAKSLELGTYTYTIVSDNYHTSEGHIVLDKRNGHHIEKVPMRPNFSHVTLKADEGTLIYIDDVKMGQGTWSGDLKAGSHNVECRKPRHKSVTETIEIEVNNDRVIELKHPIPQTGMLAVTSDPLGASIWANGKDYGVTPRIIADMLIGKHDIEISKDGYKSTVTSVEIREGETTECSVRLVKGETAKAPRPRQQKTVRKSSGGSQWFANAVAYIPVGKGLSVNIPRGVEHYGVMGGTLGNWGWYAKAMLDGYSAMPSITAGLTKRLFSKLYIYAGLGYARVHRYDNSRSYYCSKDWWEDDYGHRYSHYYYNENEDEYYYYSPHNSLALDAGFIFRPTKWLNINVGATHLNAIGHANQTGVHLGLGYNFGNGTYFTSGESSEWFANAVAFVPVYGGARDYYYYGSMTVPQTGMLPRYGVMGGKLGNWGWYAKATLDGYSALPVITAGFTKRLCPALYLYGGAGYALVNKYDDYSGGYISKDDYFNGKYSYYYYNEWYRDYLYYLPASGAALDLGFIIKPIKDINVNIGVTHVNAFKGTNQTGVHFGVGYNFGGKAKSSKAKSGKGKDSPNNEQKKPADNRWFTNAVCYMPLAGGFTVWNCDHSVSVNKIPQFGVMGGMLGNWGWYAKATLDGYSALPVITAGFTKRLCPWLYAYLGTGYACFYNYDGCASRYVSKDNWEDKWSEHKYSYYYYDEDQDVYLYFRASSGIALDAGVIFRPTKRFSINIGATHLNQFSRTNQTGVHLGLGYNF